MDQQVDQKTKPILSSLHQAFWWQFHKKHIFRAARRRCKSLPGAGVKVCRHRCQNSEIYTLVNLWPCQAAARCNTNGPARHFEQLSLTRRRASIPGWPPRVLTSWPRSGESSYLPHQASGLHCRIHLWCYPDWQWRGMSDAAYGT